MTIEEFLQADKSDDGSCYMVGVKHHKTGQYDKAYVYVTNELYTLISRYYNGVRREQMFAGFYGTVMFPTSTGHIQDRLDGAVNLFNTWVQRAGNFCVLSYCDDRSFDTKSFVVPNDNNLYQLFLKLWNNYF